MKIAFFDTHQFDRDAFEAANARFGNSITYFGARIDRETAKLAAGFEVICAFVNDRLDAGALEVLHAQGVRLLALRSAGFNNVDLDAVARLDLKVVRVPEYSPHAVAEYAVGLALALNRRIHRAHARVREWNFSLEGLVGFDLYGKTVGVIGTGRIGAVAARIFRGFGCRVLAFDLSPGEQLVRDGVEYLSLNEILPQVDLLSLHVPLTPSTRHLVGAAEIGRMKRGVMIINTGRGALIDSRALIDGLKSGQVGSAGLDVYEEEEAVFFRDLSNQVLQDDVLARLITFPNVLVTSHQAFLTREALANIAETTLSNIRAFERGEPLPNEVKPSAVLSPVKGPRDPRAP